MSQAASKGWPRLVFCDLVSRCTTSINKGPAFLKYRPFLNGFRFQPLATVPSASKPVETSLTRKVEQKCKLGFQRNPLNFILFYRLPTGFLIRENEECCILNLFPCRTHCNLWTE